MFTVIPLLASWSSEKYRKLLVAKQRCFSWLSSVYDIMLASQFVSDPWVRELVLFVGTSLFGNLYIFGKKCLIAGILMSRVLFLHCIVFILRIRFGLGASDVLGHCSVPFYTWQRTPFSASVIFSSPSFLCTGHTKFSPPSLPSQLLGQQIRHDLVSKLYIIVCIAIFFGEVFSILALYFVLSLCSQWFHC